MSGNTIGRVFRLTTFGESHGSAIGGVIDGCPSGLDLDMDIINRDLTRRRAVDAPHSTTRFEADEPRFLSGVSGGKTTGAPIAFIVENRSYDPSAYSNLEGVYRPGHGDYAWHQKFGHFDHRGGGRYSARETVARVIAGSVARQLIGISGIEVQAWVSSIGKTTLSGYGSYESEAIESSVLRCPDKEASELMLQEIERARSAGDTLGGVISASVTGMVPGLGEPIFDKLEAELGKAMMSIPAVKGFEIGEGFQAARMTGSEHNDTFRKDMDNVIIDPANHSGGMLGGISTGSPVHFRVAFKPVSSIKQKQQSVTHAGEPATVDLSQGRHDVCVVPRAVVIVEAMTAIVLADMLLRNRCAKL